MCANNLYVQMIPSFSIRESKLLNLEKVSIAAILSLLIIVDTLYFYHSSQFLDQRGWLIVGHIM